MNQHYLRVKGNTFRPVSLLEGPKVRPAAKAGQRLGSWMSKGFYRPMCLVSFTTERGHRHTTWVKAKRVFSETELPNEAAIIR